ncbi:hypothetical protein V8E54_005758 [Elaphomyces granulatus]
MTREPNKRKQLAREMVKERERQGKIRKLWETKSRRTPEHGWASSEHKGVDSEDDELEDEVLVNEAEDLEQVNESAFARLMASSIDESSEARPIQNATRKGSGSSRKTEKRQRGTARAY